MDTASKKPLKSTVWENWLPTVSLSKSQTDAARRAGYSRPPKEQRHEEMQLIIEDTLRYQKTLSSDHGPRTQHHTMLEE